MKPKQRQEFIVKLLMENEGYLTLNEIALECNVTSRTVNSDLDAIETNLLHDNYVIKKKRGVGIKLKVASLKQNQGLQSHLKILSKHERILKIIEMLLIEEQVLTYEALSEKFNISVSSLRYDLEMVSKILCKDNELRVVSDKLGTRISGSELDTQLALENYLEFAFDNKQNILENNDCFTNVLKDAFGCDMVNGMKNTVDKFLYLYGEEIIEYYYRNLIIKIIVLTFRASKNKHISKLDLKTLKIRDVSWKKDNKLLKLVSEVHDIAFTNEDNQFFNYIMYILHFEDIHNSDRNMKLTQQLISRVSDILKVDLTTDLELITNLSKHLGLMISRINAGLVISNPFKVQIKNEMKVTYNTICLALSDIGFLDYTKLNENEIGFLTLHIQAAIEREEVAPKVLIVCPNGVSTSNILWNRLTKILPISVNIEQASISELCKKEISDYDLIISTTEITYESHNCIKVSPFLDNNDKRLISKMLEKKKWSGSNLSKPIEQNNHFKNFFDLDCVFIEVDESNMKPLLKFMCIELEKGSYIKKEYFESVLEREQLGGTELPFGVAIPHGKPEHVIKSVISIATSEKGIKWNGTKVNMVILLCISKNEITNLRDILFLIDDLIQDRQLVTSLIKSKNKVQILDVLQKGVESYEYIK